MINHTQPLFLGFGSNLGEREATIRQAVAALAAGDAMSLVACSSLYESPAMLPEGAEKSWDIPYINAVAQYETSLSPQQVLERVKAQEMQAGRQERGRWGPRELDIDVLAYADLLIDTPELELPHSGIAKRDFVLLPWFEIAPDWQHPPIAALHAALHVPAAKRIA